MKPIFDAAILLHLFVAVSGNGNWTDFSGCPPLALFSGLDVIPIPFSGKRMPALSAFCSRLLLLFCCGIALPVFAAVQLDAPDVVRDALQRGLSLDDAGNEALDETAQASLERRLRKEAEEILATEGYFSPRIDLRAGNDSARDCVKSVLPEPVEGSDTTAGFDRLSPNGGDSLSCRSSQGYMAGALVLHVEPGSVAHIGCVDIEIRGAVDAERRAQLLKDWSLPSGEVFRQRAWDDAKQNLLDALMSVDHARARLLSSQAEVDVESGRVDLQLVYDAGPRYRYGEIRYSGLQRYPASLAERYTGRIESGDAYRQEAVLATQSELQNTPYFSSVSIELDYDAAAPAQSRGSAFAEAIAVPVNIRVRERAPFNVGFGVGVSTNTGARVEGNFRNADLFGRGWELNTGARIEQLQQTVYADVFLPPDPAGHRDSFGTYFQQSDIQDLEIKSWSLAASRVQMRGSVEQRLGLNWQYEEQTPEGSDTTVNRALTATAGWVWHYADEPQDAAEGIVAQVQLGAAAKALLSDQNFLRTYFRYSQGIPLGKSDALLLRGELGATLANSSEGIPQDYLFRAGGTNSVRGYSYQSLGVQQGGATLGGRYLITVSAEYTHWFDNQWGIAFFADAGQAADNRDVFKLAAGYGTGARWKSPVGPLAIDVAWGQRDEQWRMSFSLAVPF